MENKCKRFLSLLLALVMVIGLMPMGHAHAEESAASINLALNKEATASSIGSNCGPELAVDGNTGSPQWNSVNMKNDNTGDEDDQDDQWLQVDLGTTGATIYEIKLWYNLKVWPMTYRIETTDTPEVGGSWETVVAVDRPSSNGWVVNGPGQDIADTSANTDTITTTSNPSLQMTVLKRYVRFYVEKVNAQAPGDNVNLREIQIFHQHDWTDATCTAPKTCSGCGATEGNALGHTAAAAVEENRVEATCTVAGSYDSVVYCSACGEELSRDTVTVPATGVHTPAAAVEENRTESTCTVAGSYDSVVYCSACGEELSRTKIDLELAAHTPGEAVEENRVESTCTVAGSYDSVVYCSVCNAEISRETKALELAAHTEEIIPGKAATCTETGLTDGVKCSVCGKILTAQEEIPMAAHTEETIPGKAATCTETGLTEGTKCSVCGKVLVAQEVVPALGHTPAAAVEENRVEPTLNSTGSYDSVVYCSVCNTELSRDTVTIPALSGAVAEIDGYKYGSFQAAYEAAKEGETITLLAPVVITEDTTLEKKVTVDGTGMMPAFRVQNDAMLRIYDGTFVNESGYLFISGASDSSTWGDVVISGGSFKALTSIASVTYGQAVISGGTFECVDGEYDAKYMLNCIDANYKIGMAQLHVFGGSFVGFNPMNNAAEGAGTNFVVEGYCSRENEGVWTVYNKHDHKSEDFEATFDADAYTVYTCACGDTYTVTHEGTKKTVVAVANDKRYESLAEAVEDATPGTSIALMTDTTEDIVLDKAVTLNLTGKTLNGQIIVKAAANVSNGTVYAADKDAIIIGVKDNTNDESISLNAGNLKVTSETDCAVLIYDGNATFDGSCTLTSNSTGYAAVQGSGNQFGNITLNGTTVTSANEVAIYWPHVGTLTTSGGTITGATGLYIKQGTANLNGTKINATGAKVTHTTNNNGGDSTGDAITVDTGATAPVVNLMGVILNSTNSNLVGIYGGTVNLNGAGLTATRDAFRIEAGTLNLNSGSVTAGECAVYIRGGDVFVGNTMLRSTSTEYAAVQGNGTCGGNLTVNGGWIVNDNEVAIYWPGSGNLTVNGGTITGTTGIYAKQGNVTISDGIIEGKGDQVDFNHNGNGGDSTGDALVLESCDYGTLTASITGGEFKSTNGKAVATYAQTGSTELTGFISGGSFSSKVEESHCAEGYIPTDKGDDGNYTVEKLADKVVMQEMEVKLEAEIQLQYTVAIPEALAADAKIVLTKDGRFGEVTKEFKVAELDDNNGIYAVEIGVASGEMTCPITIEVFDGEGNAQTLYNKSGKDLGTAAARTVVDYARKVLTNNANSAEKKALAVALVTYGGYAQKMFNVKTDKLASDLLDELGIDQLDLSAVTAEALGNFKNNQTNTTMGVKAAKTEAVLDSYISYRVYLNITGNASDYTYTVQTPDGLKTLEVVEADGVYYVEIPEIASGYIDSAYEITVKNSNGETNVITTSVLAYVRSVLRNANNTEPKISLAKALYLYNQAADAHFGK